MAICYPQINFYLEETVVGVFLCLFSCYMLVSIICHHTILMTHPRGMLFFSNVLKCQANHCLLRLWTAVHHYHHSRGPTLFIWFSLYYPHPRCKIVEQILKSILFLLFVWTGISGHMCKVAQQCGSRMRRWGFWIIPFNKKFPP